MTSSILNVQFTFPEKQYERRAVHGNRGSKAVNLSVYGTLARALILQEMQYIDFIAACNHGNKP
jgi:hypothetical protein